MISDPAPLANFCNWLKADIPDPAANVRFTPESGYGLLGFECLLLAKIGRSQAAPGPISFR